MVSAAVMVALMSATAGPHVAPAAPTLRVVQSPLSFALATTRGDATAYDRVDLARFVQPVTLSSGRRVRLDAVSVPGTWHGAQGERSVRVVHGAVELVAEASGRAVARRTLTLELDGQPVARLRLDLELDLLGLGRTSPELSLRRAEITEIDGLGGALDGCRLAHESLIALPAAPVRWPVQP